MVNAKAVSACLVYPSVDLLTLPHGRWSGKWSGYTVEFDAGAKRYRLQTDIGVRGLNIPCVVVVSEDGVEIEAE